MKKIKKRGAVLFLVLLLVLVSGFFTISTAAATQAGLETPVTMEISYGFGDTARADRYLQVNVTLENQTDAAFRGSLRILTTESSLEVYQYEYPTGLLAGEKKTQLLGLPLGVKTDQLFVSLIDEKGTEILKKRLKLNISSDITESFVGVFSDTPEQLQFLDEVGIHYGSIKTKQVLLDAATAPQDLLGYDQMDLILVSDYDLNRLSEAQYQALDGWVKAGGTLLLGGGERCQETLGRFATELLEHAPGFLPEGRVNLGMEYAVQGPEDAVLTLPCAEVDLKNGSSLMQGDQFPILSYVNRKKGRIVVAAFALDEIRTFCEEHPAFTEKFYTLVLGESKTEERSQMEYYGFSRLYFAVLLQKKKTSKSIE